jgi:hypothetical protein
VRKVLIGSAVFFLLFVYWLVLSQLQVSVFPEALSFTNYPGFFDYHGITNVHTNRNLGSGAPSAVIRAAQDVGLDYLMITDLNAFGSDAVPEGYNRQLLVMSGEEYSYLDSRILTYDLERRHEIESLGQAQVLLADLLSQSGSDAESDLLVLAHPAKPGFSWTGPYPSGLDGIEVINLKSLWQKAWNESKASFLWSALVYPFNPQFALLRLYEEPTEELSLWDKLSTTRPTIGMAGAEATARTGPVGSFHLKFPTYQRSFSLVSNHVLLRSELTGEPESDRRKILKAISAGQFYMCLDILGNPKGFAAFIQDREHLIPMGGHVKFRPGLKIVSHIPRQPIVPFETKFFKDGQELMASNSLDTEYEIHSKGVYRLIVRVFPTLTLPDGRRWMTWIYSNPFYVE